MLVGDMAGRWAELGVRRTLGEEWAEVSTSSTSNDLFRAVGEEGGGEGRTGDTTEGENMDMLIHVSR